MGARIIPHVSAIIKHSLHSIKVAIQATAVSLKIRRGAIAAAISALEAVVRGAPTFVTPQIPALLQLATDIDIIAFQEAGADDKISTVRTQLISAITKHIGSGLLFSAIHRHWLQIEQTTLAVGQKTTVRQLRTDNVYRSADDRNGRSTEQGY